MTKSLLKTSKQLVASAETKNLLLSPFYGTDMGTENSGVWKKALKDYIQHTLQSICIIKRLKQVPSGLIASKSVTLQPLKASKIQRNMGSRVRHNSV